MFHLEDIGPHYATHAARVAREPRAPTAARSAALGYDDAFIRMWEYYFCYCEGGVVERAIGDVQMLLVKPGSRLTETEHRACLIWTQVTSSRSPPLQDSPSSPHLAREH